MIKPLFTLLLKVIWNWKQNTEQDNRHHYGYICKRCNGGRRAKFTSTGRVDEDNNRHKCCIHCGHSDKWYEMGGIVWNGGQYVGSDKLYEEQKPKKSEWELRMEALEADTEKANKELDEAIERVTIRG